MAHRFPRVLEPNERERLLSDAREQNYLTRSTRFACEDLHILYLHIGTPGDENILTLFIRSTFCHARAQSPEPQPPAPSRSTPLLGHSKLIQHRFSVIQAIQN